MSHTLRLLRFARHWHARIGVLAALFLVFLALSGLALNHTDGLRLDSLKVGTPWLMRWYGLHADVPSQGFPLGGSYVAGAGRHWVMDGRIVPLDGPVVGAVEAGGVRYVATSTALYLFQPEGALLEVVSGAALPGGTIRHIGLQDAATLCMHTGQGSFATQDALRWVPTCRTAYGRSIAVPLPDPLRARIAPLFAPELSLERVLLDLHSGRILGRYGPWLMDVVALVALVLALSGVWIYWRSIRSRKPLP